MTQAEPTRGEKSYHHGNLRAVLLDAAEQTLREQGADRVSLRELARRAGVSHGAPNRHFHDRQALLDALVDVGFDRLGDELDAAIESAGEDFEARLRAVVATFVHFAAGNAALLELMLTGVKAGQADPPEAKGYRRPYLRIRELIQEGHRSGRLCPGDPGRLELIILATLQGVAALIGSLKLPREEADALVAETTALFARH